MIYNFAITCPRCRAQYIALMDESEFEHALTKWTKDHTASRCGSVGVPA